MLIAIIVLIWVLALLLFSKTRLYFFRFVIGSVGMFWILMYLGTGTVDRQLEFAVTLIMDFVGRVTRTFSAYPIYRTIVVYYKTTALSFIMDYECSGFIETLVYICLLTFYPVYGIGEKIKLGLAGSIYIFCSNIIRVFAICVIVKIFGPSLFFLSHTVIARVFFFALMIILYYLVFTRPHVLRQKVGGLDYNEH